MNLAPNGKKSNLTDEQYKLVRTPAFKKWFGDWEKAYETGNYDNVSKVIDEETKEPLVVLHGSPIGETTIFDFEKGKSSIKSSALKEYGLYFTTNKKIARLYKNKERVKTDEYNNRLNSLYEKISKVRNNREYDILDKEIELMRNGRVYEVFLNLRKIVTFDAKGKANIEAYNNLIVDAGYDIKRGREAMYLLKEGFISWNAAGEKVIVEKVDGIKADNIIELSESSAFKLEKQEKEDYLGTSFLVFPDEKGVFYNVKLADGTNTIFDANNPDIRYKTGGEINNNFNYEIGGL